MSAEQMSDIEVVLWSITQIAERGLIKINGEPIKRATLWRWCQPKKSRPFLRTAKPGRDLLTCKVWVDEFLRESGLGDVAAFDLPDDEQYAAELREELENEGFEVGDDQ